jgi:hypothetical protein
VPSGPAKRWIAQPTPSHRRSQRCPTMTAPILSPRRRVSDNAAVPVVAAVGVSGDVVPLRRSEIDGAAPIGATLTFGRDAMTGKPRNATQDEDEQLRAPREEEEAAEDAALERRLGDAEILGEALSDFGSSWDVGGAEAADRAEAHLLKMLRMQDTEAFNMVADMIDPAGESYWRLEFRRRAKGAPRKHSSADATFLALLYGLLKKKFTAEGRASPAKTARGELAAEYKMTDEQVRAIIDREKGKRLRRRGRK